MMTNNQQIKSLSSFSQQYELKFSKMSVILIIIFQNLKKKFLKILVNRSFHRDLKIINILIY